MPIYEYECHECGAEFEKMVRFSEMEAEQTCPLCKSDNTHKKVSIIASFGGLTSESKESSGSCGTSGGFT